MTVHFESEALHEYRDAAVYSEERFGLGEKFVQAVESSLSAISRDPETFQLVGDSIRIFRMKRFPYYLFYDYAPESQSITIYAVAHHSRRPDYWRKRLR
jgi:mRNA-degrading endonuclease RelE of RelBE toxin-antitoxin system